MGSAEAGQGGYEDDAAGIGDGHGQALDVVCGLDEAEAVAAGTLALSAATDLLGRSYDHVISAVGFQFDFSVYAPPVRPVPFPNGRYPLSTASYESANVPGMWFAGTLSHALVTLRRPAVLTASASTAWPFRCTMSTNALYREFSLREGGQQQEAPPWC